MITDVTKMELLEQVNRELKDPLLVLDQHYYYEPMERHCYACAIGVFYRALNSLTMPVLNETPANTRGYILTQLRPVFSTEVMTDVEKLFRVRYDPIEEGIGDATDPMNRPILSTIVDMMMEMEGELDYDTVLEALNELGLGE